MDQKTMDGILYGVWLLTPVITFVVLALVRASRSLRVKGTLAAAVFSIPAYMGLTCLFSGMAWPPDIFFQRNSPQVSVSIPNYRIDYAQQWGLDFYETYFEVTRQDGLKAYLEIDGDDNKCWDIKTQQAGTKIYFLCDEETITEQTSYVDTEQELLYIGGIGCSRLINNLLFRNYLDNPLVNREESGSNELYCR